ncbi:hypothetical protein ABFT80_20925 [Mesorhizobium sp. SB112]|uniref:hypothetical protein n=1 Tax=Mesorhizobium sp. SB112 TaxID=3151853 RepID=UPI0032638DA0
MSFFAKMLSAGMVLFCVYGQAYAFETPEAVAKSFCEARVKGDDAAQRALFSPSLLRAVDEAEARNKLIADANPGEKPPFGDGIPFQGFQDHAPVCKPGKITGRAGRMEIQVSYDLPDFPGNGWSDRLVLVENGKDFLVDDIKFAGLANSDVDLTLRRVLFEAFDQ